MVYLFHQLCKRSNHTCQSDGQCMVPNVSFLAVVGSGINHEHCLSAKISEIGQKLTILYTVMASIK